MQGNYNPGQPDPADVLTVEQSAELLDPLIKPLAASDETMAVVA